VDDDDFRVFTLVRFFVFFDWAIGTGGKNGSGGPKMGVIRVGEALWSMGVIIGVFMI
jgi:hypothetical protein